jgi:lipid-binding SYLF domain-containing protein
MNSSSMLPATSGSRINNLMRNITRFFGFAPLLLLAATVAHADKYSDATALFRNAGDSAGFFRTSHAYAVFPTVGEAGFILGGAHGKGRVYVHDKYVGDTAMTQLSAGFQAGGKVYTQIIFFEDKRALDEFESGTYEFDAGVSAVAITAGASASAGTTGATSGASGGAKDATTATGGYQKGVAVFTIAKGGLMYAATVAGQKFTYTPLGGG